MKSINTKNRNMEIHGDVFNYSQYMDWVRFLVEEGKTSGTNQSSELIAYTNLNLKRMNRLNKTVVVQKKIIEKLKLVDKFQIWNVISEPWCGDCAQILPVLAKIADSSDGAIELRIMLRDANPEWIEKYHTNGSHSIPKLIAFNVTGEESFTWGARPAPAQKIYNDWKAKPDGRSWDDFELELHTWYAKDKTHTIQQELYEILSRNPEIIANDIHQFIFNN